jgi:hypothetical protein
MTAGRGGEELYKQNQSLNVSYAMDSYHSPRCHARCHQAGEESRYAAIDGYPNKM